MSETASQLEGTPEEFVLCDGITGELGPNREDITIPLRDAYYYANPNNTGKSKISAYFYDDPQMGEDTNTGYAATYGQQDPGINFSSTNQGVRDSLRAMGEYCGWDGTDGLRFLIFANTGEVAMRGPILQDQRGMEDAIERLEDRTTAVAPVTVEELAEPLAEFFTEVADNEAAAAQPAPSVGEVLPFAASIILLGYAATRLARVLKRT